MKCHVLSCSGALRRLCPPRRSFVRPCPACRSSMAFRSAPFRSPRRRRPGRAGPFFARIACAPVSARARARFAPARFARLIARARRKAHLSRAFLRAFFAPARTGRRSGPAGCRFLLPHISTDFPGSSSISGIISKKCEQDIASEQRRCAAFRFEDSEAVDADPIGYH